MSQKSLGVRPTAAAYTNLGTIYFYQGRYREAVTVNEKAVQLAPGNDRDDFILWGNLADSYRWTPELADKAPAAYRHAIEAAQRRLQINPKDARVLSIIAVYWAKLADNQNALGAITKALQLGPSDLSVGFSSVLVYELTHQRAQALAALSRVLKGGYSIEEVRREPELDQLRRDPAYQRLAAGAVSNLGKEH
jgi:serine/threonine-protein kinase